MDKERASYISANFRVGLFAGEVKLVAPPNRVPGDHGLQRAVLSSPREECHAEAIRHYLSIRNPTMHNRVNLLGNGDHTVRMP